MSSTNRVAQIDPQSPVPLHEQVAAALRRITVPTLVIHGLHDPLVAPSGGLAIARAIPDSRFVGFSGMGHDLPRALWPEFIREIAALAARGDRRHRQRAPAG